MNEVVATLLKDKSSTVFSPPASMRNAHLQTILSSAGPRKIMCEKRFSAHKQHQQQLLLSGGNGVRLAGMLNLADQRQVSSKLAILIHGWEGCHDSTYMQSMANHLLGHGIDVFRLNLRDHGGTHQLNKEIFNSTMIDEVVNAIEDLQRNQSYSSYHLIGFSLGGNFSLRVASLAHRHAIRLANIIAFCPVVHAAECNTALSHPSNWFYQWYFVGKWKRSLRKKLEYFPDYGYANELDDMKSLNEMNEKLIPEYTPYYDLDDYFDAYAISGERLASTICPCYLHFAKDDMIIPVDGVEKLADNPDLHITVTEHGGHCGYLTNWKLDSWQDERALAIINGKV